MPDAGDGMDGNLVKAQLNLYAVIKNLEDLIAFDPQMREMAGEWKISVQFIVRGGPSAYIDFRDGACSVGRGRMKGASIILYFLSPAHLNRMFDGVANPIPLKGFSKIGFLTGDFTKLTERLAYYLKPTPELLKDPAYLDMNTRMTLNTAAFAIPEIAAGDPVGLAVSSHIPEGDLVMKILPAFHAVSVSFRGDGIEARKGEADKPMAVMAMKNVAIASAFLNGSIDAFTAIASGDVSIRGTIPILDGASLLLDRIPAYLS